MNLKSISYFIKIAEMKSFTDAAKELYISQSALSKSIKNLECELETTLIDRASKKFKLTSDGQLLFANGKIILDNINEQILMLNDIVNIKKGVINIGVPSVISTIDFTKIIQKFKDRYPAIKFNIIESGANVIENKVDTGELDIGVVILPLANNNLNIIKLFTSEIVILVNKSHKLSAYSEVSFDIIKNEKCFLVNEEYMLYNRILNKCLEYKFKPNIVCTSSQWDFLVEMVSLNQGISLLPKSILSKFNASDIKLLKIKDGFLFDVGVITKKNKYLSKATNLFIEFIQQNRMFGTNYEF